MKLANRYKAFLSHFRQHQPVGVTLLNYGTPFELLVAVILSAQCTDRRINEITPGLFVAFPTPYHLAKAHFDEVFPYIRSVSYPNSKARYLIDMAGQLVRDFGGRVPDNVADLEKLRGVGRKTAHVVLSTLYNRPVIAVDTHVFRVSRRLGLVSGNAHTPRAVENELMRHLPSRYRAKSHHWFISHGRNICTALRPKCRVCPFSSWCLFGNGLAPKSAGSNRPSI
ncbi:MAG: endonuclease III [Bacteroidota bacterium]